MKLYSEFFTTLHDEDPILGNGIHYSVLRALVWVPQMSNHDFAIIWGADHDSRILWVAEQLYVRLLLHHVLFISESASRVTVLTSGPVAMEFERGFREIAGRVSCYCSEVCIEPFRSGTGYIADDTVEVSSYLNGINERWSLGTRGA